MRVMAAPRKYPEELRERAVRMAVDARRDPVTRPGALQRVGEQLGINPETLRGWVGQAEVDAGDRPGTSTSDAQRLVELERENRELRRSNAILRSVSDAARSEVIAKVHADNFGVYGVRKVHAELNRKGHRVPRCTVHRLMRTAGLRGISRAKGPRTTIPGTGPDTRPDLVDRKFTASGPNQLWVADITYCRTFAGWVYAAFVIDVFSRRVVGWQLSTSLRTDLALDALEMGIWTHQRQGRDVAGVTHHSDKGVQYLAVRYTQRLAEAGAVASVGSTGDSYDNALAEAFNSLFKAELVRNKGP